jgi:seryl-tRNA synthetase
MLDIRLLRADPDAVKAGIARRGEDPSSLDEVLALDEQQRRVGRQVDDLRAEIKRISKEVGTLRQGGRAEEAAALQQRSRDLGATEKELATEADDLAARVHELLLYVPNLPADDCPDGEGEADNVVVRVEDHDPDGYADHQRVPHWDIGTELGILDVDRAVRMSGSMFVMYRGPGARLVRALVAYGLDRNRDAFEEIRPPTLVKTETMISTGHLPKFEDDAYHLERDDLWAIPTAEVPLTSLLGGEILDEAELPIRLMAHTSCFRREAGSAGRDTRGLLRVHEFDKVELYAFCTPEQAPGLHGEILERAENAVRDLGLAHRILDLCTADIGGASARTFDIEVWAPGADRWLEVSSVSWCRDYQARRANIRYRPTAGGGNQMVHSLNGSGLAVPRVWAAIVETYRQADGSIRVPDVLVPYMGGLTEISGPRS